MKRPAKKPACSRNDTSNYRNVLKSNHALMEATIETLKEHARILDEQNSKLKAEKQKLISENNLLACENKKLQKEVSDLRQSDVLGEGRSLSVNGFRTSV